MPSPTARLHSALVALAVCLALGSPPEARAQRAEGDSLLSVDRYLHWERASSPRVSPDGSRIVYTRRRVNRVDDRWESEIWILRADGSRHRHLVDGSGPRWSPDGSRLAYLAEGEPEGTQIFVRWMDGGGGTTQVTHLTQSPHHIRWGPGGERISFLREVSSRTRWQVQTPDAPEGASWTDPPRLVHRMHYRLDPRGFTEEAYTHLFVVPADGGTPRQLTSGEWNVGARYDGIPYFRGPPYDWLPDGSGIVFDGFRAESARAADRNYDTSHLYAVSLESREVRRLTRQPGTWAAPVVSPDGRWVAYTGYGEDHPIYYSTDLWVRRLDGSGERRRISGDLDRSADPPHWDAEGRGVYFSLPDRGRSNVYYAPADGSGPRRVTEGRHMLSLSSISGDGTAVGVRSAPRNPGDVVRFDLDRPGRIEELTDVNGDVLRDVRLGRVEEVWYRSSGGARIQGWIVKPPGFDPGEEYPMILAVHGGPHGMYDVGFDFSFQNFAANGFVVLYTNPRGSAGYGTDFAATIHRRGYPSVDHGDLMAGVDTLVGRGYVDADRLYITGCSGGGKLSSWAIGHTDRFAAAAVRCPVTNWIAQAGNSDVPLWTHNWFEEPFWEDPSEWLKRSSVMYAGEVDAPTLLMTGELDARTPISQTEQFYQALKVRGVPAVMLRFREEHHGTGSRPSNFLRTQLYIMDWFASDGRVEGLTAPER